MQLPKWLFWLIIFLIPLAFFVNLGLQPFIDDEGNRSLVALEMIWSGNFVTPTLHGAYYYNKPPLWNWILAASFQIFGRADEFTARVPAILSLLGFPATIVYFFKQHFSWEKAVLGGLMFLTLGRIILWESLLGLIDICFSWVVFTSFMVIYHYFEKKQWWQLFIISYTLMAAGFMLKGLPALVFQGLTILAYFIYKKEFKRLFHWPHILGTLLGIGWLAGYYFIYHQYNDLDNVFNALFVESGKRTAIAYSIGDTLKHVINFPIEIFYHFLPWTIFVVFAFYKDSRGQMKQNNFAQFCLLIFGVNILVYWLSPNFYPRYILMLMPLLLGVFLQLFPTDFFDKRRLKTFFNFFLGLLFVLMAVGLIIAYFNKDTQIVPSLEIRVGAPLLGILVLAWYFWRLPKSRFFITIAALLVFRLGFNLTVLMARSEISSSVGQQIKQSSIDFAERWSEKDVAVFYETHMEPTVSFYMENHLQRIIPRHNKTLSLDQYYILNPEQYNENLLIEKVDSFRIRHRQVSHYYVGKLRTVDMEEIDALTLKEPPGF